VHVCPAAVNPQAEEDCHMNRYTLITAAVGVAVLMAGPAFSQDSSKRVLRATGDGFPIHVTYYPAAREGAPAGGTMNSPVVVFLHDANETRLLWDKSSGPRGRDPLPVFLQKNGYACITVDLRLHGESIPDGMERPVRPVDYERMVAGDLVAVKRFIFDEHQEQNLNMRKMGIVASGMSVPLALRFAEQDWRRPPHDDHAVPAMQTPRGQDVRAMVFLSPQVSAGRVNITRPANYLRNPAFKVAVQVVIGSGDTANRRAADTLFDIFSSHAANAERVEKVTPDVKEQGISLLTLDPPTVAYIPIVRFLDTHLKALDVEWRDRRSRRDR
jgi:pimeloyl-ACP methyl ester carboxylesterase